MMAAADKKERKRGKKREGGGQMEGDVENSAGRGWGGWDVITCHCCYSECVRVICFYLDRR